MAKANLTIQLDAEVIRRARILAAKRGPVGKRARLRQLDELVAHDERYEDARQRAINLMRGAKKRGRVPGRVPTSMPDRLDRLGG